jgi:hypothetical protein
MANIDFDQPSVGTVASSQTALAVSNTGGGAALSGSSKGQADGVVGSAFGLLTGGVHGFSSGTAAGVWGENGQRPADFDANDPRYSAGVRGSNWEAGGPDMGVAGVYAESETGYGIHAVSVSNYGVLGESQNAAAVHGRHNGGTGVVVAAAGIGVWGDSLGGLGVYGSSDTSEGVYGQNGKASVGVTSDHTAGVVGASHENFGVLGLSDGWDGVKGISNSSQHAGVAAQNNAPWDGKTVPSGFGLWVFSNATGIMAQGNPAGYFAGDVMVTGDIILINSPTSGDIAEDFDVADLQTNLEPGTVLIINAEGKLCASNIPYDTRVAGVVSGAGEFKPAVVLQRVSSAIPRSPVALLGKAFCKVDATFGSIAAGDLLTTSATRGYAMKVSDINQALGAIIGKALARFEGGRGIIPMMVSLR